ncbi:unnamed protein product [Peronospora farinosa]|uniref:C2H2-type domain-containing protein n=1 Tax=Peronospora farinosa TaxID=134698 RepID=A0AAV0UFB8_9STRA|nr:unnamed protein product [Peronospora farinosa]CAI5734463.1 unnamed protein product [Peronospora farinosa]
MLPLYKQLKSTPPCSSQSLNDAALWSLSPNFLEATTPETILALDPTGFLTHNSRRSIKESCVSTCGRTPSTRASTSYWTKVEPSREPCTDEIPWTDLVFWLGNASTGEVICSCTQCGRRAMHGNLLRQHHYSPYHPQQKLRQRVSSRVPVINLPRIEGVN